MRYSKDRKHTSITVVMVYCSAKSGEAYGPYRSVDLILCY